MKQKVYLDHWKHSPSILGDDHLIGEALELGPETRVLEGDLRSSLCCEVRYGVMGDMVGEVGWYCHDAGQLLRH